MTAEVFWYVQTNNYGGYWERPIIWKVTRVGGGPTMGIYRWQAENFQPVQNGPTIVDQGDERKETRSRVEPPTGRCSPTRLEALVVAKRKLENAVAAARKDIDKMTIQLYWIGNQPALTEDPPQYVPDPRIVEESPGG